MTDNEALRSTLGNQEWMVKNIDKLRQLLPETWTNIQNIDGLKLGFGLKLLGVDWRSKKEFGMVMVFLEKAGIMLRDGFCVRRKP